MHAPLTPSAKLRLLADEIERDEQYHFDMGSGNTCAYAYAVRMFYAEHKCIFSDDPEHHFAEILGIPLVEASRIYGSTHIGEDRVWAAKMLRERADKLEEQLILAGV